MSASILFLVALILALFGFLVGCAPAPYQPSDLHRKMIGLLQKFDRFDHDGDGFLTRDELDTGIRNEGTVRLTPAELDRVMSSYDTNHDLRISFEEAQFAASYGPAIFEEHTDPLKPR